MKRGEEFVEGWFITRHSRRSLRIQKGEETPGQLLSLVVVTRGEDFGV
jgi:hypothetical protein